MKTTKKNIVEAASKKDLNGNSCSKIKTYFKATPKSFFFEKKIDKTDKTQAIYVQALEDKLKSKVICIAFYFISPSTILIRYRW